MNDQLDESGVIREGATVAAQRVTKKVIHELQHMTIKLSGDDSVLENPWDEICVQVQLEQSVFWDAYNDTVKGIVGRYVSELPSHECKAIWLQTPAGNDWTCEELHDREASPVKENDIVEYVTNEHVYSEAGHWTNDRIRAYIDRFG